MTPFVWQDRLVKLEGGQFLISAKGDHSNWDFTPDPPHDGQALAGNPGALVTDIQVIDQERLLLVCPGRDYVLWMPERMDDWRIDPVQRPAAVPPPR